MDRKTVDEDEQVSSNTMERNNSLDLCVSMNDRARVMEYDSVDWLDAEWRSVDRSNSDYSSQHCSDALSSIFD